MFAAALCACAFAAEPPEIPLGANGAPGSEGKVSKEKVEMVGGGKERRVSDVVNPAIAVYLMPKEIANGAAVIVAPGGGHRFHSFDHEGHDLAKLLANAGVIGDVLNTDWRAPRSGV